MWVWRAIWGPVREVGLEGRFWVNSRVNLVNSRPYSRKPHQYTKNCLHLAVGRPLRLNMTKYGSWDEGWLGYRYSTPPDPPSYPTPGTPLPYPLVAMSGYTGVRVADATVNMVVGSNPSNNSL